MSRRYINKIEEQTSGVVGEACKCVTDRYTANDRTLIFIFSINLYVYIKIKYNKIYINI